MEPDLSCREVQFSDQRLLTLEEAKLMGPATCHPEVGGWVGGISEVPVCSTTFLPTLVADEQHPHRLQLLVILVSLPNKVPAHKSTQTLWNLNLSLVLIVSLRYSLDTIKFTCFKYIIQ